jgi:hypothetical protein
MKQSKLLAIGIDATDEHIRTVLQLITTITPPLAYMGGYDTSVVISTAFLNELAIGIEANSTVTRKDDHSQQAKRQKVEDYVPNDTLVKPRLWSDIHGNKVNIVLRGCTQAILSTILRMPGITEVYIYIYILTI